MSRVSNNPEVLQAFAGPGGEDHTFNMLSDLAGVRCPTLVMGGDEDPMTPIECQPTSSRLCRWSSRMARFPGCGHGVVPDAPARALATIRDFVEALINVA